MKPLYQYSNTQILSYQLFPYINNWTNISRLISLPTILSTQFESQCYPISFIIVLSKITIFYCHFRSWKRLSLVIYHNMNISHMLRKKLSWLRVFELPVGVYRKLQTIRIKIVLKFILTYKNEKIHLVNISFYSVRKVRWSQNR